MVVAAGRAMCSVVIGKGLQYAPPVQWFVRHDRPHRAMCGPILFGGVGRVRVRRGLDNYGVAHLAGPNGWRGEVGKRTKIGQPRKRYA